MPQPDIKPANMIRSFQVPNEQTQIVAAFSEKVMNAFSCPSLEVISREEVSFKLSFIHTFRSKIFLET